MDGFDIKQKRDGITQISHYLEKQEKLLLIQTLGIKNIQTNTSMWCPLVWWCLFENQRVWENFKYCVIN